MAVVEGRSLPRKSEKSGKSGEIRKVVVSPKGIVNARRIPPRPEWRPAPGGYEAKRLEEREPRSLESR